MFNCLEKDGRNFASLLLVRIAKIFHLIGLLNEYSKYKMFD